MPRFERMGAQDRSPVLFLDQLLAGAARDVGEDQIRRIIGADGVDLDLPAREVDAPIDFASGEYGRDDPECSVWTPTCRR